MDVLVGGAGNTLRDPVLGLSDRSRHVAAGGADRGSAVIRWPSLKGDRVADVRGALGPGSLARGPEDRLARDGARRRE
eukprot:6207215-Alexandrium_andersonii.AAC.1